MKNSKLFLLGVIILPWLTLPILGRDAFKKYLPSAIFICLLTKLIDVVGEKKSWWRFYKGIPPLKSIDFLNLGPYFVTSLWMLKMTYGKFQLYTVSNLILQSLFTFLGLKYVKRYKIFSLKRLTKFQYLGLDFVRAMILYGFQTICDWKNQTNKC